MCVVIVIAVIAASNGAVATVDRFGELVLLEDFPVRDTGGKLVVDTDKLAWLIRASRAKSEAGRVCAILDRTELTGGAFVARTREVLDATNTRLELSPRGWRSEYGVQSDSETTIAKAALAAPSARLDGPCGVNRARVLLLARLVWRQSRQRPRSKTPRMVAA